MYGYDPWAAPTDLPAWSFAVRTPVSLEDLPACVRPDDDPRDVSGGLAVPSGAAHRVDQRFPEDDLVWGRCTTTASPRWRSESTGRRSSAGRRRRSCWRT